MHMLGANAVLTEGRTGRDDAQSRTRCSRERCWEPVYSEPES